MAYEIVMPQLSDSMEEGKLISWKVKEGDHVKKGDVIAEVESDKAIMEVQSFKEGTITKLAVHEGDTVPVGTVIATIDTEAAQQPTQTQTQTPPPPPKEEKHPQTPPQTPPPTQQAHAEVTSPPKSTPAPKHSQTASHLSIIDEILGLDSDTEKHQALSEGSASPKAKALAARYGLDLGALQEQGKLPTPAHEADIHRHYLQHFFTPRALELLKRYHLDPALFSQEKKHDTDDIEAYITEHDIPLPQPIDPFQKALIATVEHAAQKPVYHLYDAIETTELFKHKNHTVTVWLLKIFAKAMMAHAPFRTTLKNDTLLIHPNASISLAVANGDKLYMPVFHDINLMHADEIASLLQQFEEKAKEERMQPVDMQGSTFGISNLGMLGIARFDAMINADDSAIAAIGTVQNDAMSVTLTLDHRIVNGYQAAQFMQTLKKEALDPLNYKE